MRYLIGSIGLLLMLPGCTSKQNIPQPDPMPPEEAASVKAFVSIEGQLLEGDISRGKTIAAWNGIPVGERYYFFVPAEGQPVVSGTGPTIMVRVPDQESAVPFVGRQVIMSGTWNVPEPIQVDPDQPRQMPISLGPGGDNQVIQPEVIFIAHGIEQK